MTVDAGTGRPLDGDAGERRRGGNRQTRRIDDAVTSRHLKAVTKCGCNADNVAGANPDQCPVQSRNSSSGCTAPRGVTASPLTRVADGSIRLHIRLGKSRSSGGAA